MFLPIVQFLRFVKGLYRTCSCARAVKTTESAETEALYAITVTIQTGPQLILQTSVLFWVSGLGYVRPSVTDVPMPMESWKPSAALVLSIICSFLSACYNSGRACMYQISNKWAMIPNMAGIAGGLYTVGVVLLRCTVVVSLYFEKNRFYLVSYLVLGIGMCSYVNALLVAFSKRGGMCSWATQADILLNTYNSACIGPLYPIVENISRSSCNINRRWSVSVGFALGVAINMLPDVVSILDVVLRRRTTCNTEWVDPEEVKSIFSCGLFKSYAATGFLLSILSSVALYFIAKRTSPHIAVLDT